MSWRIRELASRAVAAVAALALGAATLAAGTPSRCLMMMKDRPASCHEMREAGTSVAVLHGILPSCAEMRPGAPALASSLGAERAVSLEVLPALPAARFEAPAPLRLARSAGPRPAMNISPPLAAMLALRI